MESKVMMATKDKYLEKYGKDVPAAFTPHVYAMHGNVAWMHCNNEECVEAKKFYRVPSLKEVKDK